MAEQEKTADPMDRPPEEGGVRSAVAEQQEMGIPTWPAAPAGAPAASEKEGESDADTGTAGEQARGADGRFLPKEEEGGGAAAAAEGEAAAAAGPEGEEGEGAPAAATTQPPAKHPGRGRVTARERIEQLSRAEKAARATATAERLRREATQRELDEYRSGRRAPPAADEGAAALAAQDARFLREWDAAHPAPKLDDWRGSTEDYYDARADHRAERKIALREHTAEVRKKYLTAEREHAELDKAWGVKIAATRAAHPDYDLVLNDADDVPFSRAAQEAIKSSDLGGEIVYYLGRTREEAVRISHLGPAAQAREIGKIEARLIADQGSASQADAGEQESAGKSAPARRRATADEPITPVKGGARLERPAEELPIAESFSKILAQQDAYRRQRQI